MKNLGEILQKRKVEKKIFEIRKSQMKNLVNKKPNISQDQKSALIETHTKSENLNKNKLSALIEQHTKSENLYKDKISALIEENNNLKIEIEKLKSKRNIIIM